METAMNMKTANKEVFPDDFWCVTGLPGGEDFSLDTFFNTKDGAFLEEEEQKGDDVEDSSSLTLSHTPFDDNSSALPIPGDDVQGLELWTHFVPDPTRRACRRPKDQNKITGLYIGNRVEPGKKRGRPGGVAFIPMAVPVKPRSKRARTAENRSWKSPPNNETTSSNTTTSSPVSTLLFDMGGPVFFVGKTKPDNIPFGPVFPRRCNHCQATKTPQWRAGPDGPKTLCNACGVRFKSGRLWPEYRPASSPTFSSKVHSNSHRKVLEMRRKKEGTELTEVHVESTELLTEVPIESTELLTEVPVQSSELLSGLCTRIVRG